MHQSQEQQSQLRRFVIVTGRKQLHIYNDSEGLNGE